MSLAKDLGAEVITTIDENVVRGLLCTAAGRNVGQIIIGKPPKQPFLRRLRGGAILRRLIAESGDIAVYAVPTVAYPAKRSYFRESVRRLPGMEYLLSIGVVAAMTGIGFAVEQPIGYRPIAWLFLFAIMGLAFFVGRGPILMAATLSALAWDFFFEAPYYSFSITNREDQELFALYLIVALVLGQLTSRTRRREKAEKDRAERAKANYFLTRELANASDRDEMLCVAVQHMSGNHALMAVFLPDSTGRLGVHPASAFELTDEEYRAAAWTYERSHKSNGVGENLRQDNTLFIPLFAGGEAEGVAVLRFSRFPVSLYQRNMLEEQAQQIALALHRCRMHEIAEKSKVLAESERLSKTLLSAMSHEVRTPLAAIQLATSNLVKLGQANLPPAHLSMVSEIEEGTGRLNRLVGKILEMTQLETGCVKPNFELQEISDLISTALDRARPELHRHKVSVEIASDLPLVQMDFEFMTRALANLLANAGLHTPVGTEVRIGARVEERALLLTVADSGPGIRAECLGQLFNKFYRAPPARPGGTGLGLSIARGFVEAQGGTVVALSQPGSGAVFTIRLPLRESFPNRTAFSIQGRL